MKKYDEPIMEMVILEVEDILTVSSAGDETSSGVKGESYNDMFNF